MICGNYNDNYVNKSFYNVCREMIFVPKDEIKVKYKILIKLNEFNKYINEDHFF